MLVGEVGVEGMWGLVQVGYELSGEGGVEVFGNQSDVVVEEGEVLCYAAADVPAYFLAVGVGYVPLSGACEEVVCFGH